jgi:hypothetical protein
MDFWVVHLTEVIIAQRRKGVRGHLTDGVARLPGPNTMFFLRLNYEGFQNGLSPQQALWFLLVFKFSSVESFNTEAGSSTPVAGIRAFSAMSLAL